jgi:hypothetical protein
MAVTSPADRRARAPWTKAVEVVDVVSRNPRIKARARKIPMFYLMLNGFLLCKIRTKNTTAAAAAKEPICE